VLLEGPPGTGKSTLLRDLAAAAGVPYVPVEGNAELTPARLLGHFDPAQVLARGYDADVFVDGPLLEAMRSGALLYVEEANRIPEETLNVLVTVMSEAEVHVPRLGTVPAAAGFRLVAAMNPFDAVGTARISGAIYDRVSRVAMGYQPAEDEAVIVARRAPGAPAAWVDQVVAVVRASRTHPDVRIGSSVRGAIDLVRIAGSLADLRGTTATDPATGLDAALVALSGRIRLHESAGRTADDVVRELWQAVFGKAGDRPGGA
jgi:MoxR-like ATPase